VRVEVPGVLFRPMRHALVLAGVLLAGLLGTVPALAAGAAREVERDVAFSLDAEGFTVQVDVDNNDGDVNATIFIKRGPQVAYYSAPAKVTAERVTARFGKLGELDYRIAPKRNGIVDCDSAEEGEAVFEGTFVFTGENGYVHIEAPRAEGSFRIYPAPKNCPQRQLARRVVPYSLTYSGEGATLEARAGLLAKGRIREVNVFDLGQRGPRKVVVDTFPRRRTRRNFGGPRGPTRCGIRRLSLGPQEGHRDAASAAAFHRLGDFQQTRQGPSRDLEGLIGYADPRRRSGETRGRRFPCRHSQRSAAGQVRPAVRVGRALRLWYRSGYRTHRPISPLNPRPGHGDAWGRGRKHVALAQVGWGPSGRRFKSCLPDFPRVRAKSGQVETSTPDLAPASQTCRWGRGEMALAPGGRCRGQLAPNRAS
jgi:hypothetical protein